jgi:hypothetical protein
MSVQTPTPAETPAAPASEQPATGEPAAKDWQAEAEKWKKLSRENEARAKQNATAAQRLAEIEESQKTAEQKAAERTRLAEETAAKAAAEAAKLRVGIAKGLPADLVDRLVGSTPEELAEDAERLLALIKPAAPSFDAGARTTAAAPTDMNALIRQKAGLG